MNQLTLGNMLERKAAEVKAEALGRIRVATAGILNNCFHSVMKQSFSYEASALPNFCWCHGNRRIGSQANHLPFHLEVLGLEDCSHVDPLQLLLPALHRRLRVNTCLLNIYDGFPKISRLCMFFICYL